MPAVAKKPKERGIIFNADEVRAVHEGRKTQHRVLVKPQPQRMRLEGRDGFLWRGRFDSEELFVKLRCQYGTAGDRLWVREAWAETDDENGTPVLLYRAHRSVFAIGMDDCGQQSLIAGGFGNVADPEKWRSPIYMPRWASRLTLEITDVRVVWERNQWVWVITFRKVES